MMHWLSKLVIPETSHSYISVILRSVYISHYSPRTVSLVPLPKYAGSPVFTLILSYS